MADRTRKLDLDENEALHRAEWRFQRVGWVVWSLIVLAASLGLFGPGPLSSVQSSSPDGSLTVAHERFLRYHHPTSLEITVRTDQASAEPLNVKVSQTLLDQLQILRIQPEPQLRKLADGGVVYVFPREDSLAQSKLLFHVQYERLGRSAGDIGLVGQEPVSISQFVYP